jgi:hypothetical protein
VVAEPSWLGMLALFDDDVADALRRRVIPFRELRDPEVERWLVRPTGGELSAVGPRSSG